MSEQGKKRPAREEDEDQLERLAANFKKAARVKPVPRDIKGLEIDSEKFKLKDEKRVPIKPKPLDLGKMAATSRSNKKATTSKIKKKAATDRPGRPRRNGRTTRTAKNNKKAATDRPRAQSDPNMFIHYRSPRSLSSSSRSSSSSSSRRRPPVYKGTHNRKTDDNRKGFNLQFPEGVLHDIKDKMKIK